MKDWKDRLGKVIGYSLFLMVLMSISVGITSCIDHNTVQYKYTIWIGNFGYGANTYKLEDNHIIFSNPRTGEQIISSTYTIEENQ